VKKLYELYKYNNNNNNNNNKQSRQNKANQTMNISVKAKSRGKRVIRIKQHKH
jgi:hypothetical protein